MNKNTKILVGVSLIAIAGYLLWSKKKSFEGAQTWYSDPDIVGVPVYIINK
jgi:LPXTG-motif cell wall-anchored protein